jgi:hypothetical protein
MSIGRNREAIFQRWQHVGREFENPRFAVEHHGCINGAEPCSLAQLERQLLAVFQFDGQLVGIRVDAESGGLVRAVIDPGERPQMSQIAHGVFNGGIIQYPVRAHRQLPAVGGMNNLPGLPVLLNGEADHVIDLEVPDIAVAHFPTGGGQRVIIRARDSVHRIFVEPPREDLAVGAGSEIKLRGRIGGGHGWGPGNDESQCGRLEAVLLPLRCGRGDGIAFEIRDLQFRKCPSEPRGDGFVRREILGKHGPRIVGLPLHGESVAANDVNGIDRAEHGEEMPVAKHVVGSIPLAEGVGGKCDDRGLVAPPRVNQARAVGEFLAKIEHQDRVAALAQSHGEGGGLQAE